MGKKGAKKGRNEASVSHRSSMTLREISTGKREGNVNAKTMCKIDHLKNLATWAATEACIPSLGAFFGRRLAASIEAVNIRPDPDLFICQRCESVLQPGCNCTVRIEKNKPKKHHKHNKSSIKTQNSVVYNCHFCLHRNVMRGTPKGHVKEISPPKAKQPPKSDRAKYPITPPAKFHQATHASEANKTDGIFLPISDGQNLEPSSPTTPLLSTGLTLLESSKRRRKRSNAKKVAEPESSSNTAGIDSSRSKRKKSWTTLKEIANHNEHETAMKFSNSSISTLFI